MPDPQGQGGGRRQDVLGNYMAESSAGALGKYLESRARTPLRYAAEQLAQYLAGWVPGLPGMALRQLLYRPLLAKGSSAPVMESGSELLHMDTLRFGGSVYVDRLCRIHGSRAGITLGDCTRVMRGAYLCAYVSNAREGEGIVTGKRCWVGVNAVLASGQGGLTLGDDVLIGPGAVLVTGDHDFSRCDIPATSRAYTGTPITVGSNVWIGAGAMILGGARIGDNAVVAAGAVVHSEVAPGTVVGGVPAKVIKTIATESK
ncbi:acyltransferase [Fundidesulfovibrio soli]|uniref:acyltransferase n=1 Tax=Fundidesulfovibrio soli TaxID=2922716 RepID=UPI0030151EF7